MSYETQCLHRVSQLSQWALLYTDPDSALEEMYRHCAHDQWPCIGSINCGSG